MQVVDAKQGRIYISRDTYYLRTCSFPSKLGSAVAKLVNFHTGKSSNTKFVFVFFFLSFLGILMCYTDRGLRDRYKKSGSVWQGISTTPSIHEQIRFASCNLSNINCVYFARERNLTW